MKKILAGLLVFGTCTGLLLPGIRRVNKTFFMPKSQGLNTPMELRTWNKGVEDKDRKGIGANVSVTPFYERSVNGYGLARYFLPNGLNSMKFELLATDPNADVDPQHFGLASTYIGKFSIRPQRYSCGARIDYYQNLDRWLDGLFFSASVPVVHTGHSTQFKEEVTTAGSSPSNIEGAWKGGTLPSGNWAENFRYHKIRTNDDEETTVAEVDVKLGIRFINNEDYRLGIHANLLIPTGNEPNGEYLWEAVVGNGQHVGFGCGLDSWFSLWEHEYKKRSVHVTSHHRFIYLFESTQKRTLELKGKDWGRFIRMRKQDSTDTTKVLAGAIPGVNVLTHEVEVEPGVQYDATFEIHAHLDQCSISIGYNGWFRQQEDLNLKHSFTRDGVYGLSSENGTLNANELATLAVSSNTTIKKFEPANGTWLTESDIEVSGHVAAQAHKFFGTVSHEFDWEYPVWVLAGGSYQLPIKNTALEEWSVWGSLGYSF